MQQTSKPSLAGASKEYQEMALAKMLTGLWLASYIHF
jgi:hypothetical protein